VSVRIYFLEDVMFLATSL